MHEINYGGLSRLWFSDTYMDWVHELVRQLDERFVKREELPPLIFEEPEPQTGISDTADHCHSSTGTCKCPLCYTWVYPKLVSRWSCNPDDNPHPVQPKACPHDLFNSCEECYTDGQREPEPKAKCECHMLERWTVETDCHAQKPRYCPWCGLPLAGKEEKP